MNEPTQHPADTEVAPNLTLLKWIVIGMAVAIVLGLGVIVVTVVNRMSGLSEGADGTLPAGAKPTPAPVEPFGTVVIAAAGDSRILAVAAADGLILLTLRGQGGADQVVVVDAATGQERGRITLGQQQ